MKYATKYINWIDIETTGLDPQHDVILEVAVAVTDGALALQHKARFVVGHDPAYTRMSAWAWKTHGQSGLLDEVKTQHLSGFGIREADAAVAEMLVDGAPLGGSSPHFDRSFIERHMPQTACRLSHRNVDVSSMLILAHSNGIDVEAGEAPHRALEDIDRSVEIARKFLGRLR